MIYQYLCDRLQIQNLKMMNLVESPVEFEVSSVRRILSFNKFVFIESYQVIYSLC